MSSFARKFVASAAFQAYRAEDVMSMPQRLSIAVSNLHRQPFERLAELGLDERQIARELEEEGASRFSESVGAVLSAVEKKEGPIHVGP